MLKVFHVGLGLLAAMAGMHSIGVFAQDDFDLSIKSCRDELTHLGALRSRNAGGFTLDIVAEEGQAMGESAAYFFEPLEQVQLTVKAVNVSMGMTFRGFLIRAINPSMEAHGLINSQTGTFAQIPTGAKGGPCPGGDGAPPRPSLVHTTQNPRTSVTFVWTAPPRDGAVYFRINLIESFFAHYVLYAPHKEGNAAARGTMRPTPSPTHQPSPHPTPHPTLAPTAAVSPTDAPTTAAPSVSPSMIPSASPSTSPTPAPSASPSESPTQAPSTSPTPIPSASPSVSPTHTPRPTALDGRHATAVVPLLYAGTGGAVLLLAAVYCVRRLQAEPEPRWYEPEDAGGGARRPSKPAAKSSAVRVLSVDSFVLVQTPSTRKKKTVAAATAAAVEVEEDRLELTEI